MKSAFIVALLIILAACTSRNVQPNTPAPYSLKYEFYSDKNYQHIYRAIMNKADSCVRYTGMGTSSSVAEGQLYSDIKAADISIFQRSLLGSYPHIRINIEAYDNKTKIVVSNDFETWDELAKTIKFWVTEESHLCR